MSKPPKIHPDPMGRQLPPPLPKDENQGPLVLAVVVFSVCLILFLILLLWSSSDNGGSGSTSAESGKASTSISNEGGRDSTGQSFDESESQLSDSSSAQVEMPASNGGASESQETEGLPDEDSPAKEQAVEGDEAVTVENGSPSVRVSEETSITENAYSESLPAGRSAGVVAIGSLSGGVEFFGVEGSDGPVSFVIDYSSSMRGGRFDLARDQLIKSVREIKGQKFNVFLYNDSFKAFQSGKLVNPSKGNKDAFEQWVNQVRPDGGTEPLPAVESALQSGTSCIFLLTDGEFSLGVARQIIAMCTDRKVVVHAYSLNGQSQTLRDIASACNGVFTAVR